MKLTALLLRGFIFIAFSTAHSPSLSRAIYKVTVLLSFMIFLYIIQSSANSLIADSKFLQISFKHAMNRSGPNTLYCGTPDVTPTSSDNCPPTLTLCKWSKIIIIFINCNRFIIWWQWLYYMYTNMEIKKKVTRKFKLGGLHEGHVVAIWKLGNHLSIRL